MNDKQVNRLARAGFRAEQNTARMLYVWGAAGLFAIAAITVGQQLGYDAFVNAEIQKLAGMDVMQQATLMRESLKMSLETAVQLPNGELMRQYLEPVGWAGRVVGGGLGATISGGGLLLTKALELFGRGTAASAREKHRAAHTVDAQLARRK